MKIEWLILISVIFFIPSVARALDKIKPDTFISVGAEYNDNISFEPSGKTEFITTITPGINTQLIANQWYYKIEYRPKFINYQNIKKEAQNHNLNLIGGHKFSNKLLLLINGDIIEDKEETVEEDFSVTKREYLKRNLAGTIKFTITSRLETDIKYQYEDFDIRQEEMWDSKENEIFLDIYYLLSQRLRGIGVYQSRKRDYKNNSSLNLHLLGTGIEYELGPKTKGNLIIKYEKMASEAGTTSEYGKSAAFQSNLTRNFNEKTTFCLTLEQATNFTRSCTDPITVKTAKINISRELNKKANLNLSLSSMHGDWQNSTREDKLQSLNFGLSHQFSRKISCDMNYNSLNRKSNVDNPKRNNLYTVTFTMR
ncbi:MAG: outer membrane beta-barrel protein [Nitrospirota bacterium]